MRTPAAVLLLALTTGDAAALDAVPAAQPHPLRWDRLKVTIERYIGLPYVWGSSGRKSFDCSGFLWRVMLESGIAIKRTTARKYYLALPAAPEDARYEPGTVVFFDDLKHVGIVSDREAFYHAAVTRGTHLAGFDPFWRGKIIGFRQMPRLSGG